MYKKVIMLVCLFLMGMLTGCGVLESFELPQESAVIKEADISAFDQGGIEYNGRIYLDYGNCTYYEKDNIKECVGYVYRPEYPDDTDRRIYTLSGDDEENFLIQYYVSGVMENPIVLRAADTVGKDINMFDFIRYYGPWSNDFWEGGIDTSKGEVISENDTHGFHGDGLYFSEIKFLDDSAFSQIKNNEYWHKMPLSKNLNEFIYEPLDDGIKIPKVTNGYYYFYDRFEDSTYHYDDTELIDRGAYNFTVMIYDCDTDILYVCREDT